MLTHWVLPLRYRRSRAYMIVQVKNWVRPLTPEEYDEAVATNITECPLALGGDQRSGRQLIMDAPHDAFAHTVAALSQTPEGRRRLEAAVVGNSSRGVAAALASLTGGGGAVTFGPGHGPGPQSSAGHRGKSKWIPGPCQHAPPAVLAPGPGLQAVAVAGAAGPSRRPTHIRTTWRWIRSGGRTRAAAVVPRPRCSAGPMLRPGTWRWICTISRGRGFRPLHHPRQVVTKRGGGHRGETLPWGYPGRSPSHLVRTCCRLATACSRQECMDGVCGTKYFCWSLLNQSRQANCARKKGVERPPRGIAIRTHWGRH